MKKMNQPSTPNQTGDYSWNRQRSSAELTSFIQKKLAQLATVELID